MKKKILISLVSIVLLIGLFALTGCVKKNENSTNTKAENTTSQEPIENMEKVTFTKETTKSHVKYKVPEESDSLGSFKDLGHNCTITHYTNQSSVYALYPYDDKVETVNKVTINGTEYDTYKYQDNFGVHHVYRSFVNNFYHLFEYDVRGSGEYDDSQVETFMNTVEYID